MSARNPLLPLAVAATALLAAAAALASWQTVKPERAVDLQAIGCPPEEPPMSRLGCPR